MKICDVPGCVEVTVNVPGEDGEVNVVGAHIHPDHSGEAGCPCCNGPLALLSFAYNGVFQAIVDVMEGDEEDDGW